MKNLAIMTALILSACGTSEQTAACGFDPATPYNIRVLPDGWTHESVTVKNLITGPDAASCTDACSDAGYVITCPFETYSFHDASVSDVVIVTMTRTSDNISTTFELSDSENK